MKKASDTFQNGTDTERFVDLARKLVSVPKKEIDKRIEAERQQKEEKKRMA